MYAAYWSFLIRRKMMTGLYRRQTFIVGLISLYGVVSIILFYAAYFFVTGLPTAFKPVLDGVQDLLYASIFTIGLAWADSSIRVGRRLDPLLRDSFRWSRVRLVLWPLMLLSNAAFLIGSGLTQSFDLLAIAGLVLELALLGISVAVVFRAAGRAAERNYRRSLEWFVAFLVSFIVYNAGFIPLILVLSVRNLFAYTPVDFVWGFVANLVIVPMLFYCMYRCSRSLVPLAKVSLIESSLQNDQDGPGHLSPNLIRSKGTNHDRGREPKWIRARRS